MKITNLWAVGLGCVLAVGALPALTGCATDDRLSGRSSGQYADDKETTTKIKNALEKDPLYKFSGVEVTTMRGHVQLSGFVQNASQKERAQAIASKTEGVSEVINNITVQQELRPATPGTETEQSKQKATQEQKNLQQDNRDVNRDLNQDNNPTTPPAPKY